MKYIKRLLGLTPFLLLNIVGMVFMLGKLGYYWMLHGGEACAYHKKDTPKTMADIYELLANKKE